MLPLRLTGVAYFGIGLAMAVGGSQLVGGVVALLGALLVASRRRPASSGAAAMPTIIRKVQLVIAACLVMFSGGAIIAGATPVTSPILALLAGLFLGAACLVQAVPPAKAP